MFMIMSSAEKNNMVHAKGNYLSAGKVHFLLVKQQGKTEKQNNFFDKNTIYTINDNLD